MKLRIFNPAINPFMRTTGAIVMVINVRRKVASFIHPTMPLRRTAFRATVHHGYAIVVVCAGFTHGCHDGFGSGELSNRFRGRNVSWVSHAGLCSHRSWLVSAPNGGIPFPPTETRHSNMWRYFRWKPRQAAPQYLGGIWTEWTRKPP